MSQQLTRTDQIKPFLIASQKQITSLLQDDARAKRFMAASLVVGSSQALSKCTPDSVVQALIGVAMSNLNVDSNIGHCYLLPYNDFKNNTTTCQLQIGYKGFIQLLFRAGWLVKSFPVYKCDQFSMQFDGWDNKVAFTPAIDERNEGDKDWSFANLRGIYVVARHADTKDEYSTFVNKTVIEKLRCNSPQQKVGKYTKPDDKIKLESGLPIGIWADWYIEMAQSKAIKKLAKILPIGDARAAAAIASDDKAEMGVQVDYRKTAEAGVVIDAQTGEKLVGGTDELGLSVESVIASIQAATTQDELDANKAKVETLKPDTLKPVRAAWSAKQAELKGKVSAKNTDWQSAIKECGDVDTLKALLNDMPDTAQIEYAQLIDDQYELLDNQ